ncbi:MAG: hypothetical protein O3A00_11855 [Planctomycetota bacterium]|nr:hypothetical protein [Planctomycetota bacterium]
MADSDDATPNNLFDTVAFHHDPHARHISGKWLVLAMLGFGVVATTSLWIYWKLHLMPFMPLQEVLVKEFPDSSPRVDGGQRRMQDGSPMILRIVMKVAFDPILDEEPTAEFIAAVTQVVGDNLDLDEYDELHLHLYQLNPEGELRQNTFEHRLDGQTASLKISAKSLPQE